LILINGINGIPGHVKRSSWECFFGRNKQKRNMIIKLINMQIRIRIICDKWFRLNTWIRIIARIDVLKMKIRSNIIADIFGDKYESMNGRHEWQIERTIRVKNGSNSNWLLISISWISFCSLFNWKTSSSSSFSSFVNTIW